MDVMTRRQEIMIQRKKMIRVASIISTVVVIIITGIVMYVKVLSSAVMSPQVNLAIGDCFYDTGNGTWQRAEAGTSVSKGYRFKTGDRSMMDILLQNDSVVRITENAQMNLSSLNLTDIQLELPSGNAFCKIKKLYKGQGLSVKTPTAVAAVRGTEFSTEVVRTGGKIRTDGFCVGGVVEMTPASGKGAKVSISKNATCSADSTGPGARRDMTAQEVGRVSTVINSIQLDRVLITTDKLLFESGSSAVNESMKPELERIYGVLKGVDARIRIIGHTDNVGFPDSNKTLSLQRAQAIKGYFISRGIAADRFEAQGMGDTRPVISNATDTGRAKNRRVEFVVTK